MRASKHRSEESRLTDTLDLFRLALLTGFNQPHVTSWQPNFVIQSQTGSIAKNPANLDRLSKLVYKEQCRALPETLEEYLEIELPAGPLSVERDYILDHFHELLQAYLEEVQPHVHTLCDAAGIVNDTMFYMWLRGKRPTAFDFERLRAQGEELKGRILNGYASQFISPPTLASEVYDDEDDSSVYGDDYDDDHDEIDEKTNADILAEAGFY